MENVLTRNQLINAQEAFCCKDWFENIQNILDSTNDKSIEIEDKYLDLIKQNAIWKQITFCKSLNLDLKMNLPVEAKEWILEKIKGCQVVKYDGTITYYKENEKTLFVLDSKIKEFYLSYSKIYKVLEEKYSLKYNEIRELINIILEEHFKLKEYIINSF